MVNPTKSILLIEDDRTMAMVYQEYLSGHDFQVTPVETGAEALAKLEDTAVDLALVDLKLPDMDGFDILRRIQELEIGVEIVVITGHGSMNVAIDAMKLGASDFLVKPFNKDRLLTTIDNAFQRQTLTKIVKTYQTEIDRHEYQGFVGSSLAMQGVYRVIDSAAQSKVTAFVTGESGTGKEVCAEAIHRASNRANAPFIAINCGAIPKDLIESEIFGHIKGAFTGAHADRKGAAASAHGGTLFLDEICELDINLQPKILRFLQTGQVQPVGSSKNLDVDVRILCATNRDPMAEVAAGRFREDLYYRLHVLPIPLPPLRERGDDILEIARHFLALYSSEESKSFASFSPEVENTFLRYPWPGNVRQLQNVIRNMVVLNDADQIDADMLPSPLDEVSRQMAGSSLSPRDPSAFSGIPVHGNAPLQKSVPGQLSAGSSPQQIAPAAEIVPGNFSAITPLAILEKQAIVNALTICGGSVPEAAHYLGTSAATIYRKKAAWRDEPSLV